MPRKTLAAGGLGGGIGEASMRPRPDAAENRGMWMVRDEITMALQ